MKKAIIIIAAVAVLGLLGLKAQHKSNAFNPTSGPGMMGQTATQTPASNQSNTSSSTSNGTGSQTASGSYKDGTYKGSVSNIPYGNIQVAAVISGGKIVDIRFLQMPDSERESMQRTMYSEPLLKQSAINNQNANIDFVSGATDTSFGFEQSLQAALNQASA